MFGRFDIHVFGDYFRLELFWILWTSIYDVFTDMRQFRDTMIMDLMWFDVRHFWTWCFITRILYILVSSY